MDGVRVFVPVGPGWSLQELPAQVLAHAVRPELLDAFDYTLDQVEDAEYAALVLASVAALAEHGERTVWCFAADPTQVSDPDPDDQSHNGQVLVSGLRPTQLTAWYTDEPGVVVTEAAAQASGLDLDQAWEQSAVQQLLADHALLWHAPSESMATAAATQATTTATGD